MRIARGLFLIALLLAAQPVGKLFAQSADPQWVERRTPHFIVVYAQGSESDAELYAGFADEIYNWEAAVFKGDAATPITLRLYPSMESYFKANPAAQYIPGVIAHADAGRQEIAVALPRTAGQTPDERENNVRHELAHLFAAALTGDKLPTGFQEGVAQYFEKPSPELTANVDLLGQAQEQQRLLDWATLNEPGRAYGDPQVAYPEARSVVAFLVDRYGFARLLDFLNAFTTEAGYRTALERAYGVPADQLESEWQAYLPDYLSGRWKVNALYQYDLSRAQQLLDAGAYTPAETELKAAIALLETTQQPDTLARAQAMIDASRQGQAAHALANGARDALDAGDYARAATLASQARDAFAALNDHSRDAELQAYTARVTAVMTSRAQLDAARREAGSLAIFQARDQARALAADLASLGDQAGAQQAAGLQSEIDGRIELSGSGLLVLAAVVLLANAGRRVFAQRESARDIEAKLL